MDEQHYKNDSTDILWLFSAGAVFLSFFLLRFTAGIVYQYLTIYRLSDYKSDFFLFDCKGLASK